MGANIGKLIVETEEVYLEYPYLWTKYDGFILHGACHFMTWVIAELILIIYYYTPSMISR